MIVIIAPFPKPGDVVEGWMSRIAAVDRIFSRQPRIYVQIVDDLSTGDPLPIRMSELVEVYTLNLLLDSHSYTLRSLIFASELVYVHTIHLARFVLPYYSTGKIVTDIHGITPEEELLYGRKEPSRFYEEVERVVLAESRHAIVVTSAMVDHYRKKYPDSKCEFTILPIFETSYPRADYRVNALTTNKRPTVLYSGGAQKWQLVDLMLDLARERVDTCDFLFLSHQPEAFRLGAEQRGVAGSVSITSAKKEDLPKYYLEADYGLVLREDIAVNRVSCPTKLSEYLWFGVIPVVLFPELGDFMSLGYRYVEYEDFLHGRLPSAEEQIQMRLKNFEVISTIQERFAESEKSVRNLNSRLQLSDGGSFGYLTDTERNVYFPALTELRVNSVDETKPDTVLTDYFTDFAATVRFSFQQADVARSLIWMPVNRNCQIKLSSVVITDASGNEVKYMLSGNYEKNSDNVFTFLGDVDIPLIKFDLCHAGSIGSFTASFEILFLSRDSLLIREKKKVDAITNSLSWKLTSPIRSLIDRIYKCN